MTLGVRRTDVVAVVMLPELDVRVVVVVVMDVVLDDVGSVVVVVGVELPVVVVTTESVVVTEGCVVVAVVVWVTGSATAGTIPPESAVSEMATPNASATAAPRQNEDEMATHSSWLNSSHSICSGGRMYPLFSNTRVAVTQHITRPMVTPPTAFFRRFLRAA